MFQYYVRARHMALKALDVTYQIPSVTQHSDMIDIQQSINAKADRVHTFTFVVFH